MSNEFLDPAELWKQNCRDRDYRETDITDSRAIIDSLKNPSNPLRGKLSDPIRDHVDKVGQFTKISERDALVVEALNSLLASDDLFQALPPSDREDFVTGSDSIAWYTDGKHRHNKRSKRLLNGLILETQFATSVDRFRHLDTRRDVVRSSAFRTIYLLLFFFSVLFIAEQAISPELHPQQETQQLQVVRQPQATHEPQTKQAQRPPHQRDGFMQPFSSIQSRPNRSMVVGILAFFSFLLMVHVIRLYLSFESLENSEEYFVKYLAPLEPRQRKVEYLVRLFISAVLSMKVIPAFLPIHGVKDLAEFVTVFYVSLLIWDLIMLKFTGKVTPQFFLPSITGTVCGSLVFVLNLREGWAEDWSFLILAALVVYAFVIWKYVLIRKGDRSAGDYALMSMLKEWWRCETSTIHAGPLAKHYLDGD